MCLHEGIRDVETVVSVKTDKIGPTGVIYHAGETVGRYYGYASRSVNDKITFISANYDLYDNE